MLLAVAMTVTLQAKDLTWRPGSIVLSGREVIVGDIARLSLDLIVHRSTTGEITTYPAHKVSSFRYYDPTADINRIFISVATKSGLHKTYKYYERVAPGKISVLRIQQSFSETIDETNPEGFNFYLEQGRVVCPLSQFRKKYFDHVKQELDARIIAYHGLDPNTRLGALSLIILYNQIDSHSSVASLN